MVFSLNQIMMYLRITFLYICISVLSFSAYAKDIKTIETDDVDVEIRIFPAQGNVLLLGFPCDEGESIAEEKTAISLASDGIEVWMPDMLSGFMLPKARSSLQEIPTETLMAIIDAAMKTGKQVYLIASGSDTELILRSASQWERNNSGVEDSDEQRHLAGAILMFPRLFKESPVPGKIPEYVDAVGQTQLPIMLLEGERTPNRWGINALSQELQKSGSNVIAKVIPSVRGFFFKRNDANRSEDVVTSQMAGLIKVSLYYLEEKQIND